MDSLGNLDVEAAGLERRRERMIVDHRDCVCARRLNRAEDIRETEPHATLVPGGEHHVADGLRVDVGVVELNAKELVAG